MTFTYTNNPGTVDIDTVRFYTHDVDSNLPLLSDEEVQFLIDSWQPITNSLVYVSAVACEVIAARFTSEVNYSADGISISGDSLAAKFQDLASHYRALYEKETGVGAGPWFPSEFWESAPDPSLKPLNFTVGMQDNLRAGPQTTPAQSAQTWYNWYYGY